MASMGGSCFVHSFRASCRVHWYSPECKETLVIVDLASNGMCIPPESSQLSSVNIQDQDGASGVSGRSGIGH